MNTETELLTLNKNNWDGKKPRLEQRLNVWFKLNRNTKYSLV